MSQPRRCAGWQGRLRFAAAMGGIVCSAALAGAKEPVVPKVDPINLLDDSLGKFYTWSEDTQYEDPLLVYTCKDGVLQITGESWGGLTTKDEYANYHMVCEFKWGERTWGKRKERARDSGILVHCIGPDGGFHGTWMASLEAQIIEGGTGDLLVLSGEGKDGSTIPVTLTAEVAEDRDGETIWQNGGEKRTFLSGRINWFGRDPDWSDKIGFRGKNDVASPHGEWTRYEVICNADKVSLIVNGVVVNEGHDARPSAGKILVQSEGAELFVRRWELWPLHKLPPGSRERPDELIE